MIAGAKLYIQTINNDNELKSYFSTNLFKSIQIVENDPLSKNIYGSNLKKANILIEKLIDDCPVLYSTLLNHKIGEISVEGFVYRNIIHIVAHHDKPIPKNGPYFLEHIWSTPSRNGQYLFKIS